MTPLTILTPSKHAFGGLGVLVLNKTENGYKSDALRTEKEALLGELRGRYTSRSRTDLMNLGIMREYVDYYKRFDKTYHVFLQLESIVHKNKDIPAVSPLVQAMFMAEMKNFLLTAGHDYQKITAPVTISTAQGEEKYVSINGRETKLAKGDLFMRDSSGVISSIVYGPDSRTKITPQTQKVLYCAYVPFKTNDEFIIDHLNDIARYAKLNDEDLEVEELRLVKLGRSHALGDGDD